MKPPFGKNEVLSLTYIAKGANAPTHYITFNPIQCIYYLYNITDGNIVKTKHKASNPIELYKYMEE